jgi:hypothetical protein
MVIGFRPEAFAPKRIGVFGLIAHKAKGKKWKGAILLGKNAQF